MSDIDDEHERDKKEQYEVLGRFVEAFEAMVDEVRETAINLLERDQRHRRLIEIVIHHQVFSAKPLYEIFRGVIVAIIDDSIWVQKAKEDGTIHDLDIESLSHPLTFTPKNREAFLGVMKAITTEYDSLCSTRNDLLHGTWYIGYPSGEEAPPSEFMVHKYKTTKEGLSRAELPKNAEQLRELTIRCETTVDWLVWLHVCLIGQDHIAQRFVRKGSNWLLIDAGGNQVALKKK
jgi:hypothetical protein